MRDINIKIKAAIFETMEKILPAKMFDFLWSKYYIWNVKRNSTEVSEESYYVKNKNGLKGPDYCIFRFGMRVGLFSVANQMLFCHEWAVKNNYIPLVYVESPDDFMQEKPRFNNAYMWESCFQQPELLDEAFNKGNVLVSSAGDIAAGLHGIFKEINGDARDHPVHARMQNYRKYYAGLNKLSQKAWIFKPEVEAEIEKVQSNLFHQGMRVIGVVLREEFSLEDSEMTDAERRLYKRHPKALSLEETYKLIVEYMSKWNCTHVLITTLYQESLEYFQEKLGDKVISIERKRISFNEQKHVIEKVAETLGETLEVINKGRYKEIVYEDKEGSISRTNEVSRSYLIEMAAVANCDYCMGVKCGGLIGACIMNGGKFKDLYIFEDRNNIQGY